MLRAILAAGTPLATLSARSEFSTESGNISGDALAVGGTWSGTGAATDFSAAGGVATRSATSDPGSGGTIGRFATASSTGSMTNLVVSVDVKASGTNESVGSYVLGRYTDTSNWFGAFVVPNSNGFWGLRAAKCVGGTVSTHDQVLNLGRVSSTEPVKLTLSCLASGYFACQFNDRNVSAGYDPALATGGTLASGRVGIRDVNQSATATTRTYDNFAAWVPAPDAAAYAGRSVQLGTDWILRQDSGGTAYGPVGGAIGDLPRVPLGGTVETLLVPTTGDFDTLPDTMGTASISARPFRRASWLYVDDS